MMNHNSYADTIINNRYIGKKQLTADDIGGDGCKAWNQYRVLCDNVAIAAYNRICGKGIDADVLGASVAALFSFFEVEAKATDIYKSRLVAATITRKANRSDALRDAQKAKKAAKFAWEEAVALAESEESIATLKAAYEEAAAVVDGLLAEPHHFWYDLTPMLDKSKKHASASARKAIEDVIADIINERALMTIEELQAEAQALADLRKGREARKKADKKQAKKAATATAESTNA